MSANFDEEAHNFSLYRVHKVNARTDATQTDPQQRYYIPCMGIIKLLLNVLTVAHNKSQLRQLFRWLLTRIYKNTLFLSYKECSPDEIFSHLV